MLHDYEDKQVVELLKFGFPLSHDGKHGSKEIPKNHRGTRDYPREMQRILDKEVVHCSVIGPFESSPFGEETYISPLNSVPKKDSVDRRLILDLSFPQGNSINDGIAKDEYLGEWSKMSLPSVDQLAEQVAKIGKGAKIFKIDLSRAYRQIFSCPLTINWLGYVFNGKFYFDCMLSMGSQLSARCCQRVTSAVVFIFNTKFWYFAINYLDDLGGAETSEKAQLAFETLRDILHKCGLKEALEKTVPPCTLMVFLGIQVNTIALTLTIPNDKWQEIQQELSKWECKKVASLKDVQRLAGLLNFACRCVRSGRVYLSRILNFLRTLPKNGVRCIPKMVKEDVKWWREFAEDFNGVSLIPESEWSKPDQIVSSDSCLTGGGGYAEGKYFRWEYPQRILQQGYDIKVMISINWSA